MKGEDKLYCRECGTHISDKAEICKSCGVRPLNSTNYCNSCGTSTKAEQELCVKCGSRLKTSKGSSTSYQDNPSGLINFAVCCFPILGFILYFVWKNEKPKSASSVCKWAIIGFILGIVLYIIAVILGAFSEMLYYY